MHMWIHLIVLNIRSQVVLADVKCNLRFTGYSTILLHMSIPSLTKLHTDLNLSCNPFSLHACL